MPPCEDECYVMCSQCGARLWSKERTKDAYEGIPCPYKMDFNGKCKTPEEDPLLYQKYLK